MIVEAPLSEYRGYMAWMPVYIYCPPSTPYGVDGATMLLSGKGWREVTTVVPVSILATAFLYTKECC
jgi:hypothetical protein